MSNVRDYGATGDGQTDDTSAIQHALSDGEGLIEFPRGDYRITKPIVVDLAKFSRTAIRGSGGTAKLIMAGKGPALFFAGQRRLHDSFEPDAVRFGVIAGDFDVAEQRHSLALPNLWLEAGGIGGLVVCPGEEEGRPFAGHDELGGSAAAANRRSAEFGEIDDDRLRDAVVAAREFDQSLTVRQCVLNRRCVVSLAIACCSVIANVAHPGRLSLKHREIGSPLNN